MADLEIKITTKTNSEDLKKTQKDLKELDKNSQEVGKSVDKLGSKFSKLKLSTDFLAHSAQALLGWGQILGKASGAITDFISTGLELNQNYENLTHRLQNLINAADKSSNIDPLAKWNKSGDVAKELINNLKELDVKLDYSLSDLSAMFVNFYAGASGHLKPDEIVRAFETIAFAAQASGADIGSLKVTLDSLGSGMVDRMTDFGMFANSMGLTTQKLTEAIKNNNFLEVLEEHLGSFASASEFSQKKFETVMSSFNSSMDTLKQKAMEPLFKELTISFDELTNTINSTELQGAFNDLGELFADIAKGLLDPEAISGAINSFKVLTKTISSLASVASTLNDLAMPDWLAGKDNAGFLGTAIETLQISASGLEKVLDILSIAGDGLAEIFTLGEYESPFDILLKREKEALMAVENVKAKLVEYGGVLEGINLNANLIDEASLKDVTSLVSSEIENIKSKLEEVRNLKLIRGDEQIWGEVEAGLEQQLNQLIKYENVLKSVSATRAEMEANLNKSVEFNAKEQYQTLLNSYKDREKTHAKTIDTLKKQEESLTKQLLDAEKDRAGITAKANSNRADLKFDAAQKIRQSKQAGMSELAKYQDDIKAYQEAFKNAEKALIDGNLEQYERYIKQAKKISEMYQGAVGGETGISETVGAQAYRARVEELLNLELRGIDTKEARELEAHDVKMDMIALELQATTAKIEAEMSFYEELGRIQEGLKDGSIDMSAQGFEKTKAKLLELDELIKAPKSLNLDSSNAVAKVETVKQNLLTLNGKTIEVKADTTPADFGIAKLKTEIEENGDATIKINPDFTEAKKKIDDIKNGAENQEAEVKVEADTSSAEAKIDSLKKPTDKKLEIKPEAKDAEAKIDKLKKPTNSTHTVKIDSQKALSTIRNLQKNTSSTHTIRVRKVGAKSSGGLVDGYRSGGYIERITPLKFATGGGIFKRRKRKIPGHDLSGKDDVPAMLTRGEFVHNVRAVDYYGTGLMNAINERRIPRGKLTSVLNFATGGLVGVGGSISNSNRDSNSTISKDIDELIKKLREILDTPWTTGKFSAEVKRLFDKITESKKQYDDEVTSPTKLSGDLKQNATAIDKLSGIAGAIREVKEEWEKIEREAYKLKKQIEYEAVGIKGLKQDYKDSYDIYALREYLDYIKDERDNFIEEQGRTSFSTTSSHSQEDISWYETNLKSAVKRERELLMKGDGRIVLEIQKGINPSARARKALESARKRVEEAKTVSQTVSQQEDIKSFPSLLEFLRDFRGYKNKKASSNRTQKSLARLPSFWFDTKSQLQGLKTGGVVGDLKGGGKLKGYGGGDRRLALLEDGEFVIRKEAVRGIGAGVLHALNSLKLPKFNLGGAVGRLPNLGSSKISKDVNLNFNLGGGNTQTVMSDMDTALALERYFKGFA